MSIIFIRGLAVGVAAAAAVVIYGPAVARAAKPVVRQALKASFAGYMRGREALADLAEVAEDAYAEAWTELKKEADAAMREAKQEHKADNDGVGRGNGHG